MTNTSPDPIPVEPEPGQPYEPTLMRLPSRMTRHVKQVSFYIKINSDDPTEQNIASWKWDSLLYPHNVSILSVTDTKIANATTYLNLCSECNDTGSTIYSVHPDIVAYYKTIYNRVKEVQELRYCSTCLPDASTKDLYSIKTHILETYAYSYRHDATPDQATYPGKVIIIIAQSGHYLENKGTLRMPAPDWDEVYGL